MSIFGDITGFLSSGRAANAIGQANIAAEHGVLDATQAGTQGIQASLGKSYNDVGTAGQNVTNAANTANTGINTATGQANDTLQGYLNSVQGNLAPSIASGAQGNRQLQDYAASNPQFNFNLQDYLNSPALKFQMQQGSEAIQNNASASGTGAGGNVSKALEQYGQGLASTYYNQAFNQAQQQFQTNQNTTLANLTALINSGAQGNALNQSAVSTLGAPQAQNTINAGYATGGNTINATNTNAGLQQYLASLGLTGNIASADLSQRGATTAGNFAVGAGNARSSGILGQGAALTSLGSDLGSLIAGLPHG